MANERRIFANLCGGIVEDNPLAAAGTTLTSAGLAAMPVIGSTEHIVVVFDPDGVTGTPFAKRVTAHTSGATTATIEAAEYTAEGLGSARDVPRDTPWVATIMAEDVALPIDKATRTSGSLTLNSTTWANVDTGLDLVLAAQIDDVIEYGLSAWVSAANTAYVALDVATIVAGSPVNYFATAGGAGGFGVQAWLGAAAADHSKAGSAPPYRVVAGDLDSGTVTLRLRYRTSAAANKTLSATTDQPLSVWAKNHGQRML
jgi:hypothetical protein